MSSRKIIWNLKLKMLLLTTWTEHAFTVLTYFSDWNEQSSSTVHKWILYFFFTFECFAFLVILIQLILSAGDLGFLCSTSHNTTTGQIKSFDWSMLSCQSTWCPTVKSQKLFRTFSKHQKYPEYLIRYTFFTLTTLFKLGKNSQVWVF